MAARRPLADQFSTNLWSGINFILQQLLLLLLWQIL
jgi:hypothetical protein